MVTQRSPVSEFKFKHPAHKRKPKNYYSMVHSIDVDYSLSSFSRLPKHLRHSIWRFALPDPRIIFLKKYAISRCEHAMVRVRSDLAVPDRCKDGARPDSSKILCTGMDDILPQDVKDLEEVRARIKHDGQYGFSSDAQIPNLLLVCRESYNIAFARYNRAFPSVGAFAETYFDHKRDVLLLLGEQVVCVCGWQCREPMASFEACKIDHVAFQYEPISKGSAFHQNDKIANTSTLARLSCTFYNIKSLTIVIENYRSDDHENGIAEGQRDSELVFFDPVDIGEALRMLRSPVTKRSDLCGVLIPEHPLRGKLDFDKNLLYDLQSEDRAKGLWWRLPKLRWKNLTTATFKRRFEKLLGEYELRTGVTCYRVAGTDDLSPCS
ncbi:uncharacterized protein EAF01_000763 [Botrytis porri]|uniref:uncharacterized protein n=1 Tax=Botrytis porri TaxID=87229 RepID=UPI00190005EC|nr:uncharacterized protein EAF01_000763 [Botrytis porri]KAF7914357.1 hypothetical protein EAF01_000763 [Botrytis porri]